MATHPKRSQHISDNQIYRANQNIMRKRTKVT